MATYFHGGPELITGLLDKGTCVTSEKGNAAKFARRYSRGKDCYIYVLELDPTRDLELSRDSTGVIDKKLASAMPFTERILVTDKLIAECKAQSKANDLI